MSSSQIIKSYLPTYYFKADNSTVNSDGSVNPTVTTGGSNTFFTSGGAWDTGYINSGLATGTGYGFQHSDTTAIFNDKSFTISGWFYITANPTVPSYIFHTGTAATGIVLENGSIYTIIAGLNPTTGASVTLNKWNHFAWVVNGSTQELFLNGVSTGTAVATPSTISMDSSIKYWFRETTSGTTRRGVAGRFDELAVFDSALSAADIYILAKSIPPTPMTASSTIANPAVYTNNLVAHAIADKAVYVFKLDTTANDVAGVAITGGRSFSVITNTGTYQAGQSTTGGTGSWFITNSNTTGNEITLNESSSPVITHEKGLTVEMVFYYPAYVAPDAAGQFIFTKNWSGGGVDFKFQTTSGVNYVEAGFSGGGYHTHTQGLVPGNWYHVVGRWDSSDDYTYLTINGSTETSANKNNGSGNNFGTTTSMNIGGDCGLYFDYIAFYSEQYNSTKLSGTQLTDHYNSFEAARYILQSDTYAATPMIASAYSPTGGGYPAPALTAFGEMGSNLVTTIRNRTVSATALTASAEIDPPVFTAGSVHGATHMNASADMGQDSIPFILGIGRGNPMIANALAVNPSVSTQKGALIKSQSLNANAVIISPPAYVLLSDDKWFTRLLEQNGDRAIEPVQSTLTNLPNQQTQDVIKGGFLSFFNSLDSNITTTSTINSIENQIPNYYFTKQDQYEYDSEGNILDVDTSKNVARSGAGRSSTNPTPLLSIGTYDNRERKAVKINNIEFSLPGTNRNYSNRYYNVEFSFKTSKVDQVISHGFYTSPTALTRRIGVIGLSDGKIYLATDKFDPNSFTFSAGVSGSVTAPHPKKNAKEYLLGKTNIADDQWHHIIIQYGYEDGRTQIWIDGNLERQYNVVPEDGGVATTNIVGFNGTNTIRPYIIGFNSSEELLRSEFETSGWNFSPGRFISSQNVLLNYAAYDKYEPIKAKPAKASAEMPQDSNAAGNTKRALLLYWWPEGSQVYLSEPQIFDNSLTTEDNPKSAPQKFEGWDLFPLSVTGRHGSSDILNKSVAKTNAGYINIETGATRMLDLMSDININQFDAIFFKNYPESSDQVDEYIRNEYVDKYFGLTEKDLYAQFLTSLRSAVDSGVSLYVTSKQLALDLKIVTGYRFIPSFDDTFRDTPLSIQKPEYLGSDLRSIELTNPANWNDVTNSIKPTIALRAKEYINEEHTAYYPERHNNMRHRVLNQVEYLTDDSTYIYTDRASYQHDDTIDFLGIDRQYQRFEYRLNGLQVGDEFVFGNPSSKTALGNTRSNQNKGFWAVHKDDILAGIPITGQPLQYYSQNELVDNPYKDYVHSIALTPGVTLDGKGLGGKIFVTISEVFWDKTLEFSIVDLITDYWIDIAYENGILGPVGSSRAISARDRYKVSPQYINEDTLSTEKYNFLSYWSRNDEYAFVQTDQGDAFTGIAGLLFDDVEKVGKVPNARNQLTSSTRARDALGRFAGGISGAGGGNLWFKAVTGRFTPTMNVYAPSLLTRAFWWLSDRIRVNGLVLRATPMTATSNLPNANAVPDKDVAVKVQAMVCSATLKNPSNYSFADTTIAALPMYCSAEMVRTGKQIIATPMLAVMQLRNAGVSTIEEEEVILLIDDTVAELYIREDKIK